MKAFPSRLSTVFAVIGATPLRNTIGAVFFGYDDLRINAWPLIVLDWSLSRFDQIVEFAGMTSERLKHLTLECGSLKPSNCIYVEPDGIGSSVTEVLYEVGHEMVENIPEPLSKLTLQERVIASTSYVARQLVIMSRPADQKEMTFQGVTRNHLTEQIMSVNVTAKDPEACELFNAWSMGILLSLESERE